MSTQFKWVEGKMEASGSSSGRGESSGGPGPSCEPITHEARSCTEAATPELGASHEDGQSQLTPSWHSATAVAKPFQAAELAQHAARVEAQSCASKVVARRRREEKQSQIKEENAEMQLRLQNPPRAKLYEPKAAREPRRSTGSDELGPSLSNTGPRRNFSCGSAPAGTRVGQRNDGTQPARAAGRVRTSDGDDQPGLSPLAATIPRPHSSGDIKPNRSSCSDEARRARVSCDDAIQSRQPRSAGDAAQRRTTASSDAAAQPRRSRVSMDDAQPTRSRVNFDEGDSSDQDETPKTAVLPRKSPHIGPKSAWAPS